MKAHLTKVSLALLSAAFLLGCQEQGSEPVGPDGLEIQAARRGNDKRKGDGSGTLAKLTISKGMITDPDNQEVAFFDGKNQFSIQAHDNAIGERITLKMKLGCVKTDGEGDLLSKLNDEILLERRQLFITVGKDGETSDDHKINVTWNEDDGESSFRMELRPITVLTEPDGGDALPLVFTFKGGTVVLRDVTEKRPKDRIRVTCDLPDDLTIVISLTPA